MMPTTSATPPTPKERLQQAFDETVQSISRDIPLVLHSAGDVPTPDPDTVQLVASLTVQYMGRLVDAALDAREILHPAQQQQQQLPPPPLPRTNNKHRSPTTAPPKRQRPDFWDDPLPEPKIRSRNKEDDDDTNNDDDDDNDWVGAAGVDLWETSRARAAYCRGSHRSLASAQFMFPVCHDSYVYGRIREVQAAKLTVLAPLLQEPVLHDMVQTEGLVVRQEELKQRRLLRSKQQQAAAASSSQQQQQNSSSSKNSPNKKTGKGGGGKNNKKKGDDAATPGNTSDPEEEDDVDDDASEGSTKSEDEAAGDNGPAWPGLESLLPVHRNYNHHHYHQSSSAK